MPKVLLLVHPQMRPDKKNPQGPTEIDVWAALKKLGCRVEVTAVRDDLADFAKTVHKAKPDIVFNLLEEFRDEGVYDFHVISFLEAMGIAYTGTNPRGLIVSRNKSWAVEIARGHGVIAPAVYTSKSKVKYPAFVKFVREHASRGLTERNRVRNHEELKDVRQAMKKKYSGEILVQEFVAGEDVTVSILGNEDPIVLPPWRLNLGDEDSFATERLKFSAKSRRQRGVRAYRYIRENAKELQNQASILYRAFDLSGYARLDFRVTPSGKAYFIDVNANPNLAKNEDFACSARFKEMTYLDLIEAILYLGRDYQPRV